MIEPSTFMADIHNRSDKLEAILCKLERNPELSQHNIDQIQEFRQELSLQNLSLERISRYMSCFNTLAAEIDFKLDQADRGDIRKLVAKINENRIGEKEKSPWTLAEYRKTIKKFYRVKGREELIRGIRTSPKKKNLSRPDLDDMPDLEDSQKLLEAMKNSRDKLLIALLWDTGARIGELLNLKWKDVSREDDRLWLKIRKSKTGERKIPVKQALDSEEHLEDWRRSSSSKGAESYIFTTLKGSGSQLQYRSAQKRVQEARQKVDINCRTNFHAFRKGRANDLDRRGASRQFLEAYMGWVHGSDSLENYILDNSRKLEAMLRNLEEKETKMTKTL